jgi:hypothetical protein
MIRWPEKLAVTLDSSLKRRLANIDLRGTNVRFNHDFRAAIGQSPALVRAITPRGSARAGLRLTAVALLLVEAIFPRQGYAGPPFNTELAQPIGEGNTEVDVYAESTRVQGDTSATLPGIQVDYGVSANLQLRAVVPLAFDKATGRSSQFGIGDVLVGAKYRIVEQVSGAWWPEVSVFPLVLIPTGDRVRGLGQGHATYSLPVWLQKNFGPWKVYGGGGYSIDAGRGTQNSWFLGLAALRQITEDLVLGGEVFHKEPRLKGASAGTTISFGGAYDFTARYHLYFSVGRGIQNAAATDKVSTYAALAITF